MTEADRRILAPVYQYFQTLSEVLLAFVKFYEERLVKLTFLLLHLTSPSRIVENRQRFSYYVFCFTLFAFIGIIALDSDEPFKKEENLKWIIITPLFDLKAVQKIAVFHLFSSRIFSPSSTVSALTNKAPPSL